MNLENMNLNERIYGRTTEGRILIWLTAEEYMDTIPKIDAFARPSVFQPFTVTGKSGALAASDPLGLKPAPKARKAQKNKVGRPKKEKAPKVTPPKGEVAKLAPRECPHCHESYTPRRCDQTNCLKPACRRKQQALFQAASAARLGNAPSASTPPVDRVSAIKAAQARVAARQALGEPPLEK